jgi:WbqC-like protein family
MLAEPAPRTVAIMQPYFVPYAGYFRLLCAADCFVIYDCVQFPRRGWVHRNQLIDATGRPEWLTLPLEKAAQSVLIRDLRFRPSAADELASQFNRFPILSDPRHCGHRLLTTMRDVSGTPVDYIERLLRCAAEMMDLRWNGVRSSTLELKPELRGQERIVAIAQAFGATRYVNAPGGRMLYEPLRFNAAGIDLRFLPDYPGSYSSIATRLLEEDPAMVAREIAGSTQLLA